MDKVKQTGMEQSVVIEATPPQKRKKMKKYNNWAYLWIAPAFLLMLVFAYYPPINTLILSFTDSVNGLNGEWIGLKNYAEIFFGGETMIAIFSSKYAFWKSMLQVTILTVFGILVGNAMTILLAELLFNCKLKWASKIYRYIFLITILVPGVVNMLIWELLIFSANGVANSLLEALGLSTSLWYQAPNFQCMLAIMLTGFPWVGGTSFLIYLAGLQTMPESIIEASVLDGVSTFKRVFCIDLPCLAGQLKYFLIMGIIGGFQNFSIQLVVTGSGYGTSNAALVPGYMLYHFAFATNNYGVAAAIGITLFVLTLGLTILNMKRIKTGDDA
ncbi:MAG: sugar ABC transporter permease [Clostridia bacterium]|nr:sugar ABC transporter permease [Clostridia bacterium]